MAGDEERGTGWGVIRSEMELSRERGKCVGRGDGTSPPVVYLICFVNC